MKNEAFELSNMQLKYLLNIVIGIFALFLLVKFVILDSEKDRINISLKNILDESYHGIVVFKDYDKNNHNNPTLYLKDKFQISITGEFWSKIKRGDSLVKKKGETIITVYRNKEKFILDNKDVIKHWKE
nr:hypothetical protein [uncultured Flavobacterium sp.]